MKFILCLYLLLLSSVFAHADLLTNTLWHDHPQSSTLRGNLCITQRDHFMWKYSPLPERKMVVVILDGRLQDGRLFSDALWYNDPIDMAREYIFDFFINTHGHVRYDVIDVVVSDTVPMRKQGALENYVYTNFTLDAFFDRCPDNPNHGSLTVDTDGSTMDSHCITDFLHRTQLNIGGTLFSQATNGNIDQILFFGPHKAYQYESSMCGAHPLWINGRTATIPGSPHFVIIGGNTKRGIAEMLHNNFHRWENVAPNMYASWKGIGWKYQWSYSWEGASQPYPYTEQERQDLFMTKYNGWEQFTVLHDAINTPGTTVGNAMSGIGDCHYPVNVNAKDDGAYKYGLSASVNSSYQYFQQPVLNLRDGEELDPTRGPTASGVNRTTWMNQFRFSSGYDDQRSYINWAYAAIPHGPGEHLNKTAVYENQTPTYLLNNWWCYFAAHDEFLEPIRALRRQGSTTERFPEPDWQYSTVNFMTQKWADVGYSTEQYHITVTVEGEGTVTGTGTYVWGSSALLQATPTPVMWVRDGVTNYIKDWYQIVALEDASVHVVFGDIPAIAVTNVNETISVSPDTLSYTIAGTQNVYVTGASWSNLTSGAYGSFPVTNSWAVEVPLTNGINTIAVYASNQWVTVSDEITVFKAHNLYISATGNDSNSGISWDEPQKTLAHAVANAFPGITIYVDEGTYSGAGNYDLSWQNVGSIDIVGRSPTNTLFLISSDDNFIDSLESAAGHLFVRNMHIKYTSTSMPGDKAAFYFGSSGDTIALSLSNVWLEGPYDGDLYDNTDGTAGRFNGSAIYLSKWFSSQYYKGIFTATHCLFNGWGAVLRFNDYQNDSGAITARFSHCTFVNCASTSGGAGMDNSVFWFRGFGEGRTYFFNNCVMSHSAIDSGCVSDIRFFSVTSAGLVVMSNNLVYLSSLPQNRVYMESASYFAGEETDITDVSPIYYTLDSKPYSLLLDEETSPHRGWYAAVPEPGICIMVVFFCAIAAQKFKFGRYE